MDEYIPPVSPAVDFLFNGISYAPPVSPEVDFVLGADDGGGEARGLLRANFMILLTM